MQHLGGYVTIYGHINRERDVWERPEGRGGGGLFTFLSYYIQLTQPHMLRVPHFLESFGVRAEGIEKNAQEFKGTHYQE